MPSGRAYRPRADQWDQFFTAAIADGLTNLRAFTLLAQEARKNGVSLWGMGKDYEQAVNRGRVNLGITIPAEHAIVGFWDITARPAEPDHLMHVAVIYDREFVHHFPDEIIPADIRIGSGKPLTFMLAGFERTGYPLEADLFYGNGKLGFRNVHGISGRVHGVLGMIQKILFFVPDAVHSLTLDESTGRLTTEAIINTSVEGFETKPGFRMTRIQ
jgi:hypothetical protein